MKVKTDVKAGGFFGKLKKGLASIKGKMGGKRKSQTAVKETPLDVSYTE